MEQLEAFAATFVGLVWNIPLVGLLFIAGAVFTILNRGVQFTMFRHAIDIVRGKFDNPNSKGEISHFQALCAALSATIGLGNIAGVAIAITAGGPGAVFWMWVAALLGMATKYTSISLSLIFREQDDNGHMHGGPMYTMRNGLGGGFFLAMAGFYAFATILSSFGAGNMFQSKNVAETLTASYGVPNWASGVVLCVFAAIVLIGGIKRIGEVAGKLVPLMVVLYFTAAIGIIVWNIGVVPSLLASIVTDAFTGQAVAGGFLGVLIQGVRRAVFSNEAGMGSAAMAHSAAKVDLPIREGIVGSLGPFIDTIVVCTMTALVVLITGVAGGAEGTEGAALTTQAFESVYGGLGSGLLNVAIVLFAFSTIISWSYYGEQGVTYLVGTKFIPAYRVIFICFTMIGALIPLQAVIDLSDAVFGLMAIPNILANLALTRKLSGETASYVKAYKAGEYKPYR